MNLRLSMIFMVIGGAACSLDTNLLLPEPSLVDAGRDAGTDTGAMDASDSGSDGGSDADAGDAGDGGSDAGDTDICRPEIEACDGSDNDCDGVVDEGFPLSLTSAPVEFTSADGSSDPSLTWNGSEFAFTRTVGAEVFFGRRDGDGTILGSDANLTMDGTGMAWDSTLVAFGLGWASVWTDTSGGVQTLFTRIAADGTPVEAFGSRAFRGSNPNIIFDGSGFLVSHNNVVGGDGEVFLARVGASGDIAGSELQVSPTSATSTNLGVVWTGTEIGAVYEDDRHGNREVYFARVNSAGTAVLSEVRVSDSADFSLAPSVVWTGTEYWVVWYDGPAGSEDVRFARITAAGGVIDQMIVAPSPGSSVNPNIVWTGTEAGLVWRDGDEILAVRIWSAGTVSETTNISNTPGPSANPSILWDGGEYAAAWDDDGRILMVRFGCM